MDERQLAETLRKLRRKRTHIRRELEALEGEAVTAPHYPNHDLERFHLGMIEEPELSALEEHLLWCRECCQRAEECAGYVDTMRVAILQGNLD